MIRGIGLSSDSAGEPDWAAHQGDLYYQWNLMGSEGDDRQGGAHTGFWALLVKNGTWWEGTLFPFTTGSYGDALGGYSHLELAQGLQALGKTVRLYKFTDLSLNASMQQQTL